MEKELVSQISTSLDKFINWLENYGETSFDHQSFFAGPIGGRAKTLYYQKPLIGKIAVAPIIFCEAFVPSARVLFWQRQRLPIADAHYAMGFAYLSQVMDRPDYYDKAVHFLRILEETKCPQYKHFSWGYPFDWVTGNGIIPKGTPLITTTPYAYEAFAQVYNIDKNGKWLGIMRSIAEHVADDIADFKISAKTNSCSYFPKDSKGKVVNASAYRAFTLTHAAIQFSQERYHKIAQGNLNFVLQSQQPNGSWPYAMDGRRPFVDHFHTCFVMKALAKIEKLTGDKNCKQAIDKGIKYYLSELFDEKQLPKPFAKAPRKTVYKHELYDYAESINLSVLLENRYEELDKRLTHVVRDIFSRWQKPDGSFRSRQLLLGWDNVPMHRWAQSQLFRALSFLLSQKSKDRSYLSN